MKIIYSNTFIGELGAYIAPFRFDGVVKGATEVLTDDAKISAAYKEVGIETMPITKPDDAKSTVKRTRAKK